MEASHRPFHSESSRPEVSVQDGDSPVCASVCAEWRLDGISGSKGRILESSNPSRQLQVSQVRSFRTGVSIQSSVFWSLHGTSSLHEGHGSGIDFSSSCGDQNSSVFRRLADPSSLSLSGSSSSGHSAVVVSGLGERNELGEIESSSFPAHSVSGSGSGFAVFKGFSQLSGEALVNRQRIFILRHAASVILVHAVAPAASPSLVGSSRRLDLSPVGRLLSTGSGVVAGAVASGVRHLFCADIPRPLLLVRRVRCGLGSPLGG